MNDFIFTLLVLGCSHNLDVCREVKTEPVVFQTMAACESSVEPAARSVENFPMAVVQCLPVEVSAADNLAQADWYFAADGSLQLSIPAGASTLANFEAEPSVEIEIAESNDNG